MDLEKIEGLVKIIENSSLKQFTYKDGDVKITMSKLEHPPVVAAGNGFGQPYMAVTESRERAVQAPEEEEKQEPGKRLVLEKEEEQIFQEVLSDFLGSST